MLAIPIAMIFSAERQALWRSVCLYVDEGEDGGIKA